MFMNPRLLRKQREGSTQRPIGSPFISTECLFFLFLYIPASPHLPATSLTPTTYLPPTYHLLATCCFFPVPYINKEQHPNGSLKLMLVMLRFGLVWLSA